MTSQSSFCRRNRDLAASISSNPHYSSPYLLANDISLQNGVLTGTILKSIKQGVEKVELPLTIQFFKSGVARVTIDEKRRQLGDIELPEGKSHVRPERYHGVADAVLIGGKELDMAVNKLVTEDDHARIRYGSRVDQEIIIHHYPFKIEFLREGIVEMVLNERNFFNVDHWRPKPIKKEQETKEGQAEAENITSEEEGTENEEKGQKEEREEEEEVEDEEQGMWEESFNGKTDSKPRGTSKSYVSVVDCRSRISWTGHHLRGLRIRLRYPGTCVFIFPEINIRRGRRVF